MANKLLKYIRTINDDKQFKDTEFKKDAFYTTKNPELESFIQIHPIVSQYIVTENIFNKECFRKYINAVYGHEKTKEEMEFLSKDPKNVYFYKNKQYALYTKFLMREYNKHLDQSIINNAYNKIVEEMDNDMRKQLEIYEKKKNDMKILDEELNEEKKKEFLDYLRSNYSK
jgi:hypothetical protein